MDGDPQAERNLYEKYKEIVRNYLKGKYSIYSDIEDDVSEIMIRVFVGLESYDSSKSKFSTWVFSITNNYMVDKWRIQSNTLTKTEFEIVVNDNYYVDNTFDNMSSINYISEQITTQDFTLLDMKYIQGYDYNEIGCEFNVTSSTISNRVNYIKTKLKKCCELKGVE